VGDFSQFHQERLLIVPNHESYLDGFLLGLFLPMEPVFVVNTDIAQDRFFRRILELSDYLTIDPANPMAMKKIIRLVEAGRPVVIFPEGRLTTTGTLMKVYEGPAFVAAKTGATVIPVRLTGPAQSYWSRMGGRYPKRWLPKITITIRPATTLPMPRVERAKDRRRLAGEHMRRIMQDMMFRTHPSHTLYSALVAAAELYGTRQPVVEDLQSGEMSYRDLLKAALALGRITAAHTRPGENVGVLMPNVPATLGLIFGLSSRGRIPAMLNYTAGADGVRSACIAAGIETVITSRGFLEKAKLQWITEALPDHRILYLEDLKATVRWADKLWIAAHLLVPRLAGQGGRPEDPAVVLFTSGSEGKPKGVVLSHRAILSNIAQILAVIDFSVEDKVFNALPIFHSFGLTVGTLMPILSGARLVLYPSPLHYRVIPEVVYDRNCTVLLGTSTFIGNYGKHANPYDFHRLRYVVSGAEKLAESVQQLWFEKFGIRILDGYGATETAPVLAVNTPMAFRSGTVGELLPGLESRLMPVPGLDRGGILHVRGPNVMLGYYRFTRPGVIEPTRSELGEGWYETGDVVDISDDGYLSILGRMKRFAKVAGEMVSLERVEQLAALVSPDRQHAALTRPDERRGEAILLCTTDKALTLEQLAHVARAHGFPELAIPREILPMHELPLLGTGKTDYVTLQKTVVARV
jgi:acyl-[acyl-carrier-protein]-phospholipid O-acyltransferase/long-chain-fatty-acid--[acyl-carrier-protein] ligase